MYQITKSPFQGRTRRGRRPPTRKLDLERMEERTLLSTVHALFNLALTDPTHSAALTESPSPSNLFTKADDMQNTGREVNLPIDESTMSRADVEDTQVINTLDGFNVQPRLTIPFDGSIDVSSVNSQDVFLVSLGDTLPGGHPGGEVVGINQIVWDPTTKTLNVESDQLLDQHTRYALIVTDGVLAEDGQSVQASNDFKSFRHDLNFGQTKDPSLVAYRTDLLDAMAAAARVGAPVGHIVTASVFTTQSVTAELEKIRDQIHEGVVPATADFSLGPGGARTVFNVIDNPDNDLSKMTGISFSQQAGWDQNGKPTFNKPVDITPTATLSVIPGAVGEVAFGVYHSPNYEVQPGGYIPAVGTRTGTPAVQGEGVNDIYFTLYLPFGTAPAGGWPVVIWQHGGGDTKDGVLSGDPALAAMMAASGIATIGINAVGHGYGPDSTLTVTKTDGSSVTFLEGGRGIDENGDGKIEAAEGFSPSPTSSQAIIAQRDGRIQTAADLMQLVQVIEAGVDVDGDGTPDLNGSRVYYAGASLSSWFGAPFLAVEPDVKAGVLNTLGGPEIERRLGVNRSGATSPVATIGYILSQREPALLNSPGITNLDGLSVPKTDPSTYFNENLPLRDGVPLAVTLADGTTDVIQSPETKDVPGAMALQQFLDNWEWVSQPGNPVAYAPYLRKDPLTGVAKSVIIQFAKGDENIVNPTTTAFLRAGDLADRATFYRHDLAYDYPGTPGLPSLPRTQTNPHTFMALITSPNKTLQAIALAAQQQIATFLASDGTRTIQPQPPKGFGPIPEEFFEGVDLPIEGGLPEGLNYIVQHPVPPPAPVQVSGGLAAVTIPTDAASDMLNGEPVNWSLTTNYVSPGNPLSRTVMPTSALVDLAIEALPPLGWPDPALDDLPGGLLRPARRRR